MIEVADGVWLLTGFPRQVINAYLVNDVLIDAGTRWWRRSLPRQLRGRTLSLVALTHSHPDHQGAAAAICKEFGVPLACHEADRAAMEGREPFSPQNRIIAVSSRIFAGPAHPVSRELRPDDEVAGFRVVHAPGHTAGHVMFFRERDRLAIAGDVLANIHFLTLRPGLREPPDFFSVDRRLNRQSIRMLAALKPATVCFGHGPPLREPRLLDELVACLPSE
jgi:glyoxylase-like metal-dependent hydrolase (beta-lactamase superfamily II)